MKSNGCVRPLWVSFFIVGMVIISCGAPSKEENMSKISGANIRHAAVSGQFYPASPTELKQMVVGFFQKAGDEKRLPHVIGLVSPHAGLVYSGQTAAFAYHQVRGEQYDAVVIIAPSHHEYIDGGAIWAKGAYETPLGLVPVHEEIAAAIVAADPVIRHDAASHQQEHSLEVQLPFLQVAVPNLKIVPLVVQDHSLANCQKIAAAIVTGCQHKKVLLVASSDLYHGDSYTKCVETDKITLTNIAAFDPVALHKSFSKGESLACGVGPLVIMQLAAREMGANKVKILSRTNSNDVLHERGGYVVGYGALAVYQDMVRTTEPEPAGAESEPEAGGSMGLSRAEKRQLLDIAGQTIAHAVRGEKEPHFQIETPILKENRGAFVTIHKKGNLRGCIGYIVAYKPLYQTIIEMAQAAALRDPRFSPVRPDELPDLELEISVLTPIRQIEDVTEIEVGTHGIIIERGYNSGLLLPQVATDYGWDRDTFLSQTCRKAGLPADSWRQKGTRIKIFSADVFSEKDVE